MITDLIPEIMDAMEETSPVLSAFDLCNPDAIYKNNDTCNAFLKTLIDHYGQPITDRYENDTTTTIPVINTPQAKVEFEEFMVELDGAVTSLNKKLKKKRQPTCHYAEVEAQWSGQLLTSRQNHFHRCLQVFSCRWYVEKLKQYGITL